MTPPRRLGPALGGALLEALRKVVDEALEHGRREPWRAAAAMTAWSTLVGMVWIVVAPWFADTTTYGFHDWDTASAFRYLTVRALRVDHELPGFNPYHCGGYPAWGYVEGVTNLVSPWLPFYLALPLPLAIRIEVVGMGLLAAVGAYVLAGAFTRSHAARLLVAALWAVNGRWGLQAAAGHGWHLAYAYLPWCLWCFERARRPRAPVGYLLGAAGCFALLVYSGGIYPLPHTVLVVAGYALLLALQERRLRPLWIVAVAGLIGIGLAAPKLVPMLHTFSAEPRLIASAEKLSPGAFVTLLTHPEQPFYARPARVHPYGWHEWGMYISWLGVGVLFAALVLVEGARERLLKVVGVLLVVLGFGAFHPLAPWSLLHAHVPLFKSQHVPSRFLYPAVLVLALVAAAGLGAFIERQRRRVRWLDFACAIAVSALAGDVARVAQQPMRNAMWMVAPAIPEGRTFGHEERAPFQYRRRDWAAPMLLAMKANTGVLDCYGVPRPERRERGALARNDRRYRGEAHFTDGGDATVERWTPNRATIAFEPAPRERTLVYNMRHWPGWHADVGVVSALDHAVAVRLPAGISRVTLSYTPPGLGRGLAALAVTLAGVGLWLRRRREA
jgi:hypothetical protein